ncbi:cobaltochelatase subunit CobN [Streptosporangium amethystogenes subsp. fukuiense]|uniref:cobaltochelatase subunit CobN n=1 Tax=Streptosporangium amethystogenes TaxID=2002 RepID=UPI00361CD3B4
MAGRAGRAARRPAARRDPRWRTGPRRRADGAVHGARRGLRRGARLPRARRSGEPGPVARLPLRHGAAHRVRLRTARAHPGLGPPRTCRATHRGPVIGVLYYRAHHVAGNTAFVETLCLAIEEAGGQALPVYCGSLRSAEPGLFDHAPGRGRPGGHRARRRGHPSGDRLGGRGRLRVGRRRARRAGRADPAGPLPDHGKGRLAGEHDGLSPLDAASQVAIPEFDGRIITVPFSFKEVDDEGLTVYVADPERASRVAGIAVRHGLLRHVRAPERRIAVMLSAYPTKHSRIGNAVGLDTPASVVRLLTAMTEAGTTSETVSPAWRNWTATR